jgi:ribose transport system ATP-binding protein
MGAATAADAALLEVRDASIRFGATRALRGVSLAVAGGSVHGLVGQNGSGKSSVVKIITGVYRPEAGTQVRAQHRSLHQPITASELAKARIGVVHQDLGIAPALSITENVLVCSSPTKFGGRVDARAGDRIVRELLSRLGLDVDPRSSAVDLSEAQKAVVAFARALHQLQDADVAGPGVLVLDEVTARLGPADSGAVVSAVHRLRDEGWGVLFVGHRIDEVVALCDQVTVLRDGQVVASLSRDEISPDSVVKAAMGIELAVLQARDIHDPPAEAPGFSLRLKSDLFQDIAIQGRVGEVLGITGLADSGVDALPYATVGAVPVAGRLTVADMSFDLARLTPGRAVRHGIGLIPGDRLRNGIAGLLSTEENLAITQLITTRGWRAVAPVRSRALSRACAEQIDTYDIRPTDPQRQVAYLSGGNQQKVLVARALSLSPRILCAHEPTAGVDAAARADIFRLIRQAARDGCAVMICSQDVDEVWDAADRVLVLNRGRITAELAPARDSKHSCISAVLSESAGTRTGHEHEERS